MIQPLVTTCTVVLTTASTTQILKHSRTTTEADGRKKKTTIKLATITIVAKQLYHISFLCVKEF